MSFEIEDLQNPENSVYYSTYSYDDYMKLSAEDNSYVELFYKDHSFYKSELENNFLSEVYVTPSGEFQTENDLSFGSKTIKFISNENKEAEDKLLQETHLKLEKLKEGSFRYALVTQNYFKKTKANYLYIQDVLNENDEKWKEFKKLENRCRILSFSLPYLAAKDIVEDCIEEITSYLVTGELDNEFLSFCLESLENLEFTQKSKLLLESFIQDPKHSDKEMILKRLQQYAKNISRTVKINCTDLEKETQEELDI